MKKTEPPPPLSTSPPAESSFLDLFTSMNHRDQRLYLLLLLLSHCALDCIKVGALTDRFGVWRQPSPVRVHDYGSPSLPLLALTYTRLLCRD